MSPPPRHRGRRKRSVSSRASSEPADRQRQKSQTTPIRDEHKIRRKQNNVLTTATAHKLRIKRHEADCAAGNKPEHIQAHIKELLPSFRQAGVGIYDQETGADFRYSYLGDRGYAIPSDTFEDGAYPDDDADLASDLTFRPGEIGAIPHTLYEQAQQETVEFYEIKVWSAGTQSQAASILVNFKGQEHILSIQSSSLSKSQAQQKTTAGMSPDDDGALLTQLITQVERLEHKSLKQLARIVVFDKSLLHDSSEDIRKQFSVACNAEKARSDKAYVLTTVYRRTLVGRHPQVSYRMPDKTRVKQKMDWAIKFGSDKWFHLNIKGRPVSRKSLHGVTPLVHGPIQVQPRKKYLWVRILDCNKKTRTLHDFSEILRHDYNPDPIFVYEGLQSPDHAVDFFVASTDDNGGGDSGGSGGAGNAGDDPGNGIGVAGDQNVNDEDVNDENDRDNDDGDDGDDGDDNHGCDSDWEDGNGGDDNDADRDADGDDDGSDGEAHYEDMMAKGDADDLSSQDERPQSQRASQSHLPVRNHIKKEPDNDNPRRFSREAFQESIITDADLARNDDLFHPDPSFSVDGFEITGVYSLPASRQRQTTTPAIYPPSTGSPRTTMPQPSSPHSTQSLNRKRPQPGTTLSTAPEGYRSKSFIDDRVAQQASKRIKTEPNPSRLDQLTQYTSRSAPQRSASAWPRPTPHARPSSSSPAPTSLFFSRPR